MSDFALMVRATLALYADSARTASQALIKNWPILAGSIVLYLGLAVATALFSGAGVLGSFLTGLLQVAALSLYFGWLHEAGQRGRLDWKALGGFDVQLFFAIIGVSFVLWIAQVLVSGFGQQGETVWIPMLVRLLIVVLLNSLPESVYVHRYDGLNAVRHAFDFTKRNWIEWYLPFVIIILPLGLFSWSFVVVSLSRAEPLLPTMLILYTPGFLLPGAGIIADLLGVVLLNWFMLFRGQLFIGLESGNRRKRVFQWRTK